MRRLICTALRLVTLFLIALTVGAHAQTYTVIHDFTGGAGGSQPFAGLTLDRGGNLYGTVYNGGVGNCVWGYGFGCGFVFKLSKNGSAWLLTPLHVFVGEDGAFPAGNVVFGPNGSLYGMTDGGESGYDRCSDGCGEVYNLRPPQTACNTVPCYWTATVLYGFNGSDDGGFPSYAGPVFDPAGNLYGTTPYFGAGNDGVVFKLTPSHGTWTQSVIHTFRGSDGANPRGGVILDASGNLYGTCEYGGSFGQGNVFELTSSGADWTASTLYSFEDGINGSVPIGGLVFNPSGDLYGTTVVGGEGDGGTVFELSPLNGNWAFTLLYSFVFPGGGGAPYDSLVMDAAGNLYGTTLSGGAYAYGSVFKLTPANGGWTYTDLHDFTGGDDGGVPRGGVTLDSSGNLYGTAPEGGAYGYGVVWEITP